jgi:hypothetical protein
MYLNTGTYPQVQCARVYQTIIRHVPPTASVLHPNTCGILMPPRMTYRHRTILGTEVDNKECKHVPTDTESMHRLDDERLPLSVRTIALQHMQRYNQ